MMETAENSKLEETMGTKKISVSDHLAGFQYSDENSDNVIIDMDNFSLGGKKDNSGNPRIADKLQRSLNQKGPQCVNEKKINANGNVNQRVYAASSPKGAGMPEKPVVVAAEMKSALDHSSSHQITITTSGNINATAENKCLVRRNSLKRSMPWVLDPKRIMILFATLSSMGTIILIYFTLSIAWQQ